MKDPIGWRLLRQIYGLYFFWLGFSSVLQLFRILPDIDWHSYMSEESSSFFTALEKARFVVPLLIFIWTTSGLAMMFYRTAPLGIALLAPVMVNIFLTDTVLDDIWPWALAHAAPLVALAWHFRVAYYPLWNWSPPASERTQSLTATEP